MKHVLMAGVPVLGIVMISIVLLLSLRDETPLAPQQASAPLRHMPADTTVRP
jgi:hypothetical protein